MVTGGAGFIRSHVVDNPCEEHLENVAHLKEERSRFVKPGLKDAKATEEVVEGRTTWCYARPFWMAARRTVNMVTWRPSGGALILVTPAAYTTRFLLPAAPSRRPLARFPPLVVGIFLSP